MSNGRSLDRLVDPSGNGEAPPRLKNMPQEEFELFLEMRQRVKNGSDVRFKEDHDGELIAIEEVLHRASDFK